MRKIFLAAIALSFFLGGCYEGDSAQEDLVGFVVPLSEMSLSLDEPVFELWKNWNPSEEERVFSWDDQEQSFFAGLTVICGDPGYQEEAELHSQSLTWQSIGPVGAEAFVLKPVFPYDPDSGITGPCRARLVVRVLAKDGHGAMLLSRATGFEKDAWESELLQMEAESLMTGRVEVKGAGDAELRLNLSSYLLALQPESGAAGSQLYHSLPVGEELVLEQLDEQFEWSPLSAFVLSAEGERLTISLP